MQITFGKYKGKHISEIPIGYLKWGAENLSKDALKKAFKLELESRNKPKSKVKEYNPLIFGKNNTENITSITIEDDGAYIYKKGGSYEIIDFKPFALSSQQYNQSKPLKGNKYYKYINHVSLDKFKELQQEWDRSKWTPRSPEEAFMLLEGYTYYKGMTIEDVSILSFDIEATGLNSNDPDAEVILISNTFRKDGKITKKLFDIYNYDNQQDMLREWSVWVQKVNPDIMLGHNILSYDLPYMANQDQQLLIGRNQEPIHFEEKTSKFRKDGNQSYEYNNARVHGRELIDTLFLSIKYDIGRNFPSYGLKYIEDHLGLVDDDRIKWDFEKYPTSDYKNWPEGKWEEFCQYCRDDADSPIKMFDIMAPTFFYLAQSIPKTFQQIINEATGSQLDSFMVRAYLQDGYSQPRTSIKEKYQGAISFGIPGSYQNVLSVDFHALYPSIIKQYKLYDKQKDPKAYLLEATNYFTAKRVEYKNKYKETGDSMYDGMQMAAKVIANSLYGFCGAKYLLYNSPKIAEKITELGRQLLNDICITSTGKSIYEWKEKIDNEK